MFPRRCLLAVLLISSLVAVAATQVRAIPFKRVAGETLPGAPGPIDSIDPSNLVVEADGSLSFLANFSGAGQRRFIEHLYQLDPGGSSVARSLPIPPIFEGEGRSGCSIDLDQLTVAGEQPVFIVQPYDCAEELGWLLLPPPAGDPEAGYFPIYPFETDLGFYFRRAPTIVGANDARLVLLWTAEYNICSGFCPALSRERLDLVGPDFEVVLIQSDPFLVGDRESVAAIDSASGPNERGQAVAVLLFQVVPPSLPYVSRVVRWSSDGSSETLEPQPIESAPWAAGRTTFVSTRDARLDDQGRVHFFAQLRSEESDKETSEHDSIWTWDPDAPLDPNLRLRLLADKIDSWDVNGEGDIAAATGFRTRVLYWSDREAADGAVSMLAVSGDAVLGAGPGATLSGDLQVEAVSDDGRVLLFSPPVGQQPPSWEKVGPDGSILHIVEGVPTLAYDSGLQRFAYAVSRELEDGREVALFVPEPTSLGALSALMVLGVLGALPRASEALCSRRRRGSEERKRRG